MIKVLVVDDSLFMRRLVSDLLGSDPGIDAAGTAKDGPEALEKIPQIKPDCVTLDLAMPGWDGLATLKRIMAEYPTPVVILSAHSREGAAVTLECLRAGAVGFVLKPSGELSLDIHIIKTKLIDEVKAAAKVNVEKLKSLVAPKPSRRKRKVTGKAGVVIIGASTGGIQTLQSILPSLPADFPAPILVIQHVPSKFFSQGVASQLNKSCRLPVKEAENGEGLRAGVVYVAPGGYRLTLKTRTDADPETRARPEKKHRVKDIIVSLSQDDSGYLSPSIDATMKSAAPVYDGNTVGIILSGMGRDGVEGMRAIKESGGAAIAQDESSLIFGMPKAVIDAGLADKVLPASEIAGAMVSSVSGSHCGL